MKLSYGKDIQEKRRKEEATRSRKQALEVGCGNGTVMVGQRSSLRVSPWSGEVREVREAREAREGNEETRKG